MIRPKENGPIVFIYIKEYRNKTINNELRSQLGLASINTLA